MDFQLCIYLHLNQGCEQAI